MIDIQTAIDELRQQKDNSYEREVTDDTCDMAIKSLEKQINASGMKTKDEIRVELERLEKLVGTLDFQQGYEHYSQARIYSRINTLKWVLERGETK